jgi:hypothetical protein
MHFQYWSFDKKNSFIKSLRIRSRDEIFKTLKKEGFEIFPQKDALLVMAPGEQQYYIQFGLRERTDHEKALKGKLKHRYIIVRNP